MDDYIKGLRLEVEQLTSHIETLQEQGRKQLSEYDRKILELMNQKKHERSMLDAKLNRAKAEAREKIEMYKNFKSSASNHPRIKHTVATTPSLHLVQRPALTGTTDSQAEEDNNYDPSKAAKKGATINSRQHTYVTLKNTPMDYDLKSEHRSVGEASYRSKINIDDYPIIVPHPSEKEVWIQIYCPICKGNMRCDRRWFKGVMGAIRHIRLAHRDFCHKNTKAAIYGADSVERLIERRYTAAELEDLKNGLLPAPIESVGTTEAVDKKIQEETVIEPYVAFDKYPTIIRRPDGEWVELRCSKCNGNCLNGTYLHGVDAFREHLENHHRDPVPDEHDSEAWVVERCESRKLTEHELIGLFDDLEYAQPPNKVNIETSLTEKDVDEAESAQTENFESNFGVVRSYKLRRSLKKDERMKDEQEEKEKEKEKEKEEEEEEDIPGIEGFASPKPSGKRFKRLKRRHELFRKDDVEASHLSTNSELSGKEDKEASNPSTSTGEEEVSLTWSDCCPCTLEGHECQYHKCTKTKVCMKLDHSGNCRPVVTHSFTPMCVMFQLDLPCDTRTCGFSHDEECKKFLAPHECHEH